MNKKKILMYCFIAVSLMVIGAIVIFVVGNQYVGDAEPDILQPDSDQVVINGQYDEDAEYSTAQPDYDTHVDNDQYESYILYNNLRISPIPAQIYLTENYVYMHSARYDSYRGIIEYKITNTSDYYYFFAQMDRAFILIGSDWFEIRESGFIQLWLWYVPPNTSIEWSIGVGLLIGDSFFTEGTYLFMKPLNRSFMCEREGLSPDMRNPARMHLIIEV